MSNLVEITKALQRELGVFDDGRAGLVTIAAALAEIRKSRMDEHDPTTVLSKPALTTDAVIFDPRTESALLSLDPKAVPMFREFLCLAKGTAASLGCDYVIISGNRTFAEQDALYAQGRTAPGSIVTRATGGQSNHNFRIAVDAGVFLGKIYLDDGTAAQQLLASKVHKACSEHAAACGLEWGGSWKSLVDLPHYQVATGKTTTQLRKLYLAKGSVL